MKNNENMKIFVNYSIGEVLDAVSNGNDSAEMRYLYDKIMEYAHRTYNEVRNLAGKVPMGDPEIANAWIEQNVDDGLKTYVRMACFKQFEEQDVLKRNKNGRFKSIGQIGISVEQDTNEKTENWLRIWREQAEYIAEKNGGIPVTLFESHAHYYLSDFKNCYHQLLDLMYNIGVKNIIMPAVEYSTNLKVKEMVDAPEFSYVRYGFGSHPKYLHKEYGEWTDQRWDEFRSLLQSDKVVAVGEIGLDYSYKGLTPDHVMMQKEMFGRFVDEGTSAQLPLIIHVRPQESKNSECFLEADQDAINILRNHQNRNGAVLHCFSGDYRIMEKYMEVGITHFGIGGRIYGWEKLVEACKIMDEKSILIESDCPFLRVNGPSLRDESTSLPNTSLSLYDIAERIGKIRGCSAEHILKISYENGMRLFRLQEE